MKRKLNSHKQHMDRINMWHRITSDEMVRKHWVPLLTNKAKEAWDEVEDYNIIRSPLLWPTFMELLETQGEKAKTREHKCKGKSTNPEPVPNTGIWKYCQQCRSWECWNTKHKKINYETPMDNTFFCRTCNASYGT